MPDTLEKSDDGVNRSIWLKHIYTAKGRKKFTRHKGRIFYAVSKYNYNCNATNVTIGTSNFYDKSGKLVLSENGGTSIEIAPGSIAEALKKLVCD